MMKRKSHLLGDGPGLILAFAAIHHDDNRKSDKPRNTPDEKNPNDAPRNDDVEEGNVPAEIPNILPPEEENKPEYNEDQNPERKPGNEKNIPQDDRINSQNATKQHHNKNALDSRSSSVKEGSNNRENRKN